MVQMVNGKWGAEQGTTSPLLTASRAAGKPKAPVFAPIAPPNFNYTPSPQLQNQLGQANNMFGQMPNFTQLNMPQFPNLQAQMAQLAKFGQPMQQAQQRTASPLNSYVTGLLGQSK